LNGGFTTRSHHNPLLDCNKVKNPFKVPAVFDVEVDYCKKTDVLSWSLYSFAPEWGKKIVL
jgi:hypothetical protein